MRGKMYCVGVGPGDPELITLKALRIIEEADVLAYPCTDEGKTNSTALSIASSAGGKIAGKERLPLYTPMVFDHEERMKYHRDAAEKIATCLDKGKNVAYLTLGDPTVYCTYTPLNKLLSDGGYETEFISGVTSFCAAAARLSISLADGSEGIKIVPFAASLAGTDDRENIVFMKAAGSMDKLKQLETLKNREVSAVTDCGMKTEKIYRKTDEIPDDAGYFTVVIAKGNQGTVL